MERARGYDIRIQREGHHFHDEVKLAWGRGNQLPTEWGQVKEDPTIIHADIARNTEHRKFAHKRTYLDEYIRPADKEETR